MKAVIIGGGKGCRAILEMVEQGHLASFDLEVLGVVDPKDSAPGMELARRLGIPTFSHLDEVLGLPQLEMIIELVGSDLFLEELYRIVPSGVRVVDHVMARLFWDTAKLSHQLEEQLAHRDRLESQLRAERNLFRQVLDSLPEAVIVVDRNHRLEWVNARLEELTGLRRQDLEEDGVYLDPFCDHREDASGSGHICYHREVASSQRPVHLIWLQPGDDQEGQPKGYYSVVVSPIFGEDGELAYVVETARPITEEVEQTRDTEERERQFRTFVEHALDMITIKDLQGRYLVINQPAAEFIGMNPMDCIGRSDAEILPAPLARAIRRRDQEIIERRQSLRRQETLVVDGVRHHLDTVRFPLWDYKGDIKGVCSISRDITEQKRLEHAFIQSEKLAAIGKLATSVAHEINNPLTGVLTFAEELKADLGQRNPDDPALEDFEIVIREAKRCRKIVSNLLDFARLRLHERSPQDLNAVLKRCLRLVERQVSFKEIRMEVYLDQGLPPVTCDPSRIQQVFLNLILNAADAMGQKGKIRLSTRLAPDGQGVWAEVADQGPGVPPRLRKKIFEPFFSTKGSRGNGLGLNVVQTIIEQHGGRIEVDDAPEGGALFRFYLPLEGEHPAGMQHLGHA